MILGSALFIGGAERVIANLSRRINRQSFRTTVCHLKERGLLGDELLAEGLDVVGVSRANTGIGKYLSFLKLARIVRDRRIQLIHTHTTYALADAVMCKLFCVWSLKIVHTFHFGNYPNLPGRYWWMEWLCCRFADRLVAVGIEQKRAICATYGLDGSRLLTIVNGVDLPPPQPDAEWRDRLNVRGRLVVGSISTFIEQKGLPDLLDVAKLVCDKFPDVLFVLVGSGPLRADLESRIEQLGLQEHVLLTGWKANAAASMLPLFDIFIQPSLWEAMSMVVLEAMAAGKPVVVTDVGDNRHVVQDGTTGYVVPRQDRAAMADRLGRLIALPTARKEMGEAGRALHGRLYGAHVMTRAYEELYDDAVTGSHPRGT